MLKRVAISYDNQAAQWYVDLPTYGMVNNTFAPVTPGLIDASGIRTFDDAGKPVDPARVLALNPTVDVKLPDNWPLDSSGQINAKAFRAMYAGSRFGDDSYVPPVLLAP